MLVRPESSPEFRNKASIINKRPSQGQASQQHILLDQSATSFRGRLVDVFGLCGEFSKLFSRIAMHLKCQLFCC